MLSCVAPRMNLEWIENRFCWIAPVPIRRTGEGTKAQARAARSSGVAMCKLRLRADGRRRIEPYRGAYRSEHPGCLKRRPFSTSGSCATGMNESCIICWSWRFTSGLKTLRAIA